MTTQSTTQNERENDALTWQELAPIISTHATYILLVDVAHYIKEGIMDPVTCKPAANIKMKTKNGSVKARNSVFYNTTELLRNPANLQFYCDMCELEIEPEQIRSIIRKLNQDNIDEFIEHLENNKIIRTY